MKKETIYMDMGDIDRSLLALEYDEYYIKSLLEKEIAKLYKSIFNSAPKYGNNKTTSNPMVKLGIEVSSLKPTKKVSWKEKGKNKNKDKL
jgi:hypothetical protein